MTSGPVYRKYSNNIVHTRNFSATPVYQMFWDRDPKSGYKSKEKHSTKKLIREGLKELRGEIAKWQDEVKEKFECDPLIVRPGDMDIMWEIKDEEDVKQWVVTSDRDHGEGYSSGALTLSPTGHGLFSGELDCR
ncbi:Complex I intermediate-associated protein 30, mitochondrial, partial [Halocaridina rubra]